MLITLIHILSLVILFSIACHYLYYIFVCLVLHADDIMQSDDAKYLKRKVKSGNIDVHPTEKALIVNYELEAYILGENGTPMHGNKKSHQKVIRLTTLNSRTDCAALAKEVVDKCNLIHPSKLAEVEQLIFYLKKRSCVERRSSLSSIGSSRSNSRNSVAMSPVEPVTAMLHFIDDYIELLYEDVPEKIKGSAMILQLARNPDNLIELSRNEALLSALSRVLREEWKRSIELSTNIVYTFFCLSTYIDFHPVIIQYKIGSLCMDVIDYELKRYDQWKEKVEGKKPATPDKEIPKSRIPEPKLRPKSGTWGLAEMNGSLKARPITTSYHEDLCNSAGDAKSDEESMKRKLKTLAKRQEQLLRVAFYLLLNIADNSRVEEKMHKKDIVGLLMGAMERHSNTDLLVLIISFLQKLSVYVENKNNMTSKGIIEKMAPFLDSPSPDLVNVALKLLFNLTFDTKLRNKMVKIGLLPKFVKLTSECLKLHCYIASPFLDSPSPDLVNVALKLLFNLTFDTKLRNKMVKISLLPTFVKLTSDDKQVGIAMKILYHLSMDDRVKVLFAQNDSVVLLTDMLLLSVSGAISTWNQELIALIINLAAVQKTAVLVASEGRLNEIISRAFRHAHPLLMKIVRNLSQHTEIQPMFLEYVGDIAGAVTSGNASVDFTLECLGTLSNILTPDIDICAVAQRYNLIPFVLRTIENDSENTEPDMFLEAIVLSGSLCAEESCASLFCSSNGAKALVSALTRCQSDDECVLQTLYAFRHILQHPLTARHLVNETEAPAYLIDLMQDKNPAIRKLCDLCLDIISQMESDWANRIKVERFRCHNGQWLSVVDTLQNNPTNGEEDLPPYLSALYLTEHNLFPSGSQMSLANESDSLSVENDANEPTARPQNKFTRDLEDMDFSMMANSGFLSRTGMSTADFGADSLLRNEFNLLS